MEYHSANKRKLILIHDITWMNLKNIKLRERRHTKINYIKCPEKANL